MATSTSFRSGFKVTTGGLCPVACLATPVLWFCGSCGLIKSVPLCQNRRVLTGVALCRCDVTQITVAMRVVISLSKAMNPLLGFGQAGEPTGRITRHVFTGFEQRLRKSTVIADAGPAK
jgi:hypothetical protein